MVLTSPSYERTITRLLLTDMANGGCDHSDFALLVINKMCVRGNASAVASSAVRWSVASVAAEVQKKRRFVVFEVLRKADELCCEGLYRRECVCVLELTLKPVLPLCTPNTRCRMCCVCSFMLSPCF